MNDSSRNQESETLKEKVVEVLRQIYDPEISVNIYDLGLIYDLDIDEEGRARIRMTLTGPGLPLRRHPPRPGGDGHQGRGSNGVNLSPHTR